jgi:hypothetical protein
MARLRGGDRWDLVASGRLDDGAPAGARRIPASAEVHRALEFLAGCLAAGRVVPVGIWWVAW